MFFPVWRALLGHNFTLKDVSNACGWIYFFAWSVSFYPQIVWNYQRKSVVGLSLDFVALNVFGFGCYLLHLIVVSQLGNKNIVIQDILFAAHALVCCIVTGIQCLIYERGGQRVSALGKFMLGGAVVGLSINSLLLVRHVESAHWFAEQLGMTKVAISFGKYLPQAWLNYTRKSTVGWSIHNILLDFTGGFFSILELCIDASFNGWTSDNIPKLSLGLISAGFDVFFMLQVCRRTKCLKDFHANRL
eukprot:c16132_g1_i2.p1 GENE.c16132_g1_i2~~c16132_g1_i2.p1  ORF type:complete len:254 (+),score=46.71 c16132_g1_i2:27-764(+)